MPAIEVLVPTGFVFHRDQVAIRVIEDTCEARRVRWFSESFRLVGRFRISARITALVCRLTLTAVTRKIRLLRHSLFAPELRASGIGLASPSHL